MRPGLGPPVSATNRRSWRLTENFGYFYRATLCVNAVFAKSSVRLFVRPSVTFVYCIQTVKDVVKLLSRPGSPVILVFDTERWCPIPRGTLSAEAQKNTGVGQFWDFWLKSSLCQKPYQISPGCYGTLVERHRRRIDLCWFRWLWVTSDQDFKVTTFYYSSLFTKIIW